jgi:hypothetical protein
MDSLVIFVLPQLNVIALGVTMPDHMDKIITRLSFISQFSNISLLKNISINIKHFGDLYWSIGDKIFFFLQV